MQLQVFEGELGSVRVLKDNGKTLFCLSDVCEALELTNPSVVKEAILREFEISKLNLGVIESTNNRQLEASFIDEPQLYFVLMRSDKPKAKPFRQWVVNEVLPSIRKQGYYLAPSAETTLISELQAMSLAKDALKKETDSLKDELLDTQRKLLNFYENKEKRVKVFKLEENVIDRLKTLKKQGFSNKAIREELKVSNSSIRKYTRELI